MQKQKIIFLAFVISVLFLLSSCSSEYDDPNDRARKRNIREENQKSASYRDSATNNTATSSTNTLNDQLGEKIKTFTYRVPHGSVTTQFSISLSNNTITSIRISLQRGDYESARYHENFASSISRQVVGKKLSDFSSLSTVGGASLTTDAFNSFVNSLQ